MLTPTEYFLGNKYLIHHVNIKNLMEEFFTDGTVANICFSDNDFVRILIEKYSVGLHFIP